MGQKLTRDRMLLRNSQSELDPVSRTVPARRSDRDLETYRQSPLLSALEQAFDSGSDRIVCESDIVGDQSTLGRQVVQMATGLPAAAGFLRARDRLREDRWVVFVASQSPLSSIIQQLDRWDAHRLDCFLLAVPAATGGNASSTARALRRVRKHGMRVLDLTSARSVPELTNAFKQLRKATTPCLALIDPILSGSQHRWAVEPDPPVDLTAPVTRQSDANGVVDTLVEMVRRDHRIAPVLMLQADPWLRLVEQLPDSLLRVATDDIPEAILWSAALAEGGCHPVLIMHPDQLPQHRLLLVDQLFRHRHSSTLIVDDRGRLESFGQLAELADRGAPLSVQHCSLPDLPWLLPTENAVGRLRQSLEAGRSLAVWLSQEPDSRMPVAQSARAEPATCECDQTAIARKQLDPSVLRWVQAYERIGHRGRYLWRWCLHGLELTTLSCVPGEYRNHLCNTKLMAVIYGVLLDDVADRDRNAGFLQQLATATVDGGRRDFAGLPRHQRRYAKFTCRLWDCCFSRIQDYPRYQEFADVLRYDSQQVMNTMRYSSLVNANVRVMNRIEHDLYTPHNMQMMTFAMMDLMVSPGFDIAELGPLRQAIWHAQCMGRIGNLVSTWERELADRDFSSGVFARLLDVGDLSIASLPNADDDMIRNAVRSGGIEASFLDEWCQHRRKLQAMVRQVKSVNLNEIVKALERLIRMELFSRGLK